MLDTSPTYPPLNRVSAQSEQNVHSNVQMRAPSESGGRSTLQHSQLGLSCSMSGLQAGQATLPLTLRACRSGTDEQRTNSAKPDLGSTFEQALLRFDFDCRAGVDRLPHSLHVAIAERDTTVGPVKQLSNRREPA
jgi:hypothetical protein